MKKPILILVGSTFLAGAAIIAQTTAQTPPNSEMTAAQSDAAAGARGAQAWANHCSRCHNLRSPSELNAELWGVSVQHMRARANLPGNVADDIKLFLMSSAATKTQASALRQMETSASSFANLNPGDYLHGKEVYSQTCIACHGADGKGTIPGVPDLTLVDGRLANADDAVLKNIIDGFQSEGSLMAMPPKGGNPDLTEQDIADVLAYMRKEYGIVPSTEE